MVTARALAPVFLAACLLMPSRRPTHEECPVGWHNFDGVRPSGEFSCRPDVEWDGSFDPLIYDGAGGFPERGRWPKGVVRLRVYCRGSNHPEVACDGRGATCIPDGAEAPCR